MLSRTYKVFIRDFMIVTIVTLQRVMIDNGNISNTLMMIYSELKQSVFT